MLGLGALAYAAGVPVPAFPGAGPRPSVLTLTASPNPVPPGSGPGRTQIAWSTGDRSVGQVVVSSDGLPEKLFAIGTHGTKDADWILTGPSYEFRLDSSASPPRLLAHLTVTRREDAAGAAALAIGSLALLLVTLSFRRRWFLEVAPLAALVACLWVKSVELSAWLRPGWVPAERYVLSASLAALLLVAAALAGLPPRARFVAALAVDLILTSVTVFDVVYSRFSGEVTSLADIGLAGQFGGAAPSILAVLRPGDALYFADVVAGLLVLPRYLRAGRSLPPLGWGRRAVAGLALLAAAAVVAAPMAMRLSSEAGRLSPVRQHLEYAWNRREVVAEIGVVPYHLHDLVTQVAFPLSSRLAVGEPEREEVRRFLATWTDAGPRSDLFGAARGRNVILVSAEALQAFPVGLEIGGQPVTPNLSALARESLAFANFHDQTHMGYTSDGVFTSLQALHPLPTGAVSTRFSGNRFRALPAILADRGYLTLSASGGSPFWNARQMRSHLGFHRAYFLDSFASVERLGIWMPDRELFAETLPLLAGETRPFLALLLSASSHHPYKLPEQYRKLGLGPLEGTMLGDYLQAVHYFDEALGEFVGKLRASGLLDRSVLVVYGDHYAILDDPEGPARLLGLPAQSRFHQWLLRKKVAFLIRLPRGAAAGPRTVTGGHLDIAPTLLALLGITDERTVMLGRDLTRGRDSLVAFRDGSFADGRHYLVKGASPGTPETCYEAATARAMDCGPLEARRREALTRLRVSDLVLQGDLIPAVTSAAPGTREAAGSR